MIDKFQIEAAAKMSEDFRLNVFLYEAVVMLEDQEDLLLGHILSNGLRGSREELCKKVEEIFQEIEAHGKAKYWAKTEYLEDINSEMSSINIYLYSNPDKTYQDYINLEGYSDICTDRNDLEYVQVIEKVFEEDNLSKRL